MNVPNRNSPAANTRISQSLGSRAPQDKSLPVANRPVVSHGSLIISGWPRIQVAKEFEHQLSSKENQWRSANVDCEHFAGVIHNLDLITTSLILLCQSRQ